MTINTRFGKHRTQSQRRYVLIHQHSPSGKIKTLRRSDDPKKLHSFVRSMSAGYEWSPGVDAYVSSWRGHSWVAVVIDTKTGQEVSK